MVIPCTEEGKDPGHHGEVETATRAEANFMELEQTKENGQSQIFH